MTATDPRRNATARTPFKSAPTLKDSPAQSLCLACGLCCNGVIFADVKLRPGESPALRELLVEPAAAPAGSSSLPRQRESGDSPPRSRASSCSQPCPALDGCRCRVYADRPAHCRNFQCALLQQLQAGRIPLDQALRTVRRTRSRVVQIRRWLRQLGETDESLPLAVRFRRTIARAGAAGVEGKAARLCSQLMLGVHHLNRVLRDKFYPG